MMLLRCVGAFLTGYGLTGVCLTKTTNLDLVLLVLGIITMVWAFHGCDR